MDQTGHGVTPGLTPQAALYHDDVGTESLKWYRILTGATGLGLSRNVKQLYGKLARDHHGPQGPLIGRAKTTLRVGRWSYWLFIWGGLLAASLMFKSFVMGALEGTSTWRQVALNVADTIFSSKWMGLAGKTLWHHPWLIAGLVVTLWLALSVDKWLDSKYSQFWHADNMRWKLRKAIGLG